MCCAACSHGLGRLRAGCSGRASHEASTRRCRLGSRRKRVLCRASSGFNEESANIVQSVSKLHDSARWREDARQARKDHHEVQDATVYTVRIQTGRERTSSLDDGTGGVQLCMVGENKQALLHRIGQFEPEVSSSETMNDICEIVGPDAGAACDRRLPTSASTTPPLHRRFQRGAIDEVSFAGPNLGALVVLMVGPEAGSWEMDEVVISNSREALTQRFVCREPMGQRGAPGAALLAPLPRDAVVYGSGELAVTLTPAQAQSMRQAGLEQYTALKGRILKITAALIAIGLAASAATGGADAAEAFALGGAVAMVYQVMINRSVDLMPLSGGKYQTLVSDKDAESSEAKRQSSRTAAQLGHEQFTGASRGVSGLALAGAAAPRVALVASVLLAAVWGTQSWDNTSGTDDAEVHRLSTIFTALLGFATYKVALVAASAGPSDAVYVPEESVEKT